MLLQAAVPTAQATSVSQVRAVLDGGQTTVGSVEKAAGITVTGAISARPPDEPLTSLLGRGFDAHAPLPGPLARMLSNALIDPGPGPSPVAATDVPAPQAASDLVLKRDSILSGAPSGYTSVVAEPSVGGSGSAIFQTYNWYAAQSSDNGSTWGYVSPFTTFPATSSFSGGFCCDQRVTPVTSRNLVVWSLQYIENGTTNGVRIAVAHGATGLAAGSWQYHDFTPGDFGAGYASGYWLDYPSLSVSDNYLYFTYNMFTVSTSAWVATVVGRAPLSALDANSAFTLDTYVTSTMFSLTPVSGATNRMFFASIYNSTTVALLDWPESTVTPTVRYATGLNSTYFGSQVCTAFDGTNPCGRADTRVQAGWLTATELGFAWSSAQNSGAGRPYPFTRVLILDPASPTTVLSQPDIWNTGYAYQYMAVAVNERGHLGGVIDVLGGAQGSGIASTMLGLVRDDYSGGSWTAIPVATSNAGTASLWGDYNGAMAHAAYPNTWLIGGKIQSGGGNNANSRVHNTWLMRSRDDPTVPAPTLLSISPSSGPLYGGTLVMLTGTNFVTGGTAATIGGTAATGVSVLSSTSLLALTPAGSAGTVSIDVTTTGGTATLSSAFTFTGALFTDDPLQAGTTPLKALHITELRSRIDTLRARYGLAAYAWTNTTPVPASTTIQAAHINELRSALQDVYAAAGLAAPVYSVPTVTASSATMRASIITELRAAVSAIW